MMTRSSSATAFPFHWDRRTGVALLHRVNPAPEKDEVTFCVRGVASPLLANLFLHYALDSWIRREMRSVRFCRYADDGVIHCQSEMQARLVLKKLGERLRECRLELHPEKTRIVYCQDVNRRAANPKIHFT